MAIDEILKEIKIRLRQYHMETSVDDTTGEETTEMVLDHLEDNPILEQLIRQEYAYVMNWLHFPTCYTDDMIETEMYIKYRTVWQNCVVYEFVKEGAEFQNSHTELGIVRHWKDKSEVFKGIVPYTTIYS